jgi:hypothetical protein
MPIRSTRRYPRLRPRPIRKTVAAGTVIQREIPKSSPTPATPTNSTTSVPTAETSIGTAFMEMTIVSIMHSVAPNDGLRLYA